MIKLLEIATTMVIFLLVNKAEDYYSSDLIELHLLNGNIEYVKVNKSNKYSCPKSCSINHFHNALILEDEKKVEKKMNYNLFYNNKNKMFLNGINVINAFEIIEAKKSKKNKVSKTERNRLDLKNFINKYN